MKHNTLALLAAVLLILTGCAEDTGTLGIYATEDAVSTSTDIFEATTKSLSMGAVVGDNSNSYLGKVVDPETGCVIEANFAGQFYCLEDYNMPKKELLISDPVINPNTGDTISKGRGVIHCDSCEVRLYIKSYYGPGNNPVKLDVYALDSTKIMNEDSTYYSNVDLTRFLADDAAPIASKVFTPQDYILTDAARTSSSHNANVRVMLPRTLGQRIMEKYYASPKSFKDSYHFIREVLPGFYFDTSNGEGTMLTVQVSTVNVYFRYGDAVHADSLYHGITRFAATPEVIQSTRFDNSGIEKLMEDNTCTYLKTPAGICTEVTLPIDEIFEKHATDSVSLASISFTRYNKSQEGRQLGTPQTLLMVRKDSIDTFFKKKEVSNSKTSYTCSFDSTYNSYTFSNICRLISYCKHEKVAGAKAAGITEAQWAALHPNWNKVALIPVVTSSNTSGNQTSVTNDMSMSSVRLIGGSTDKIKMQVIYSKFYQGNQ